MGIWLKTLSTFTVITFTGVLMDHLLLREGVPRFDLLLLSNALVGGTAAVLVIVLGVRQQRHSAFVASRMRVIREMNHHIRNALQVISYGVNGQRTESQVQNMQAAVNRITWTLREVLPQVLEEDADPKVLTRRYTASRPAQEPKVVNLNRH
jgi:hypothetical protein